MEDYFTEYPTNITYEHTLNQLENHLQKYMKIYVMCPFDKNHKIMINGLQKHLRKCMKNNFITGPIVCPINNQHIVDTSQILEHCNTCPNIEDVLNSTSFEKSNTTFSNNNFKIVAQNQLDKGSLRRLSEFKTPINVPSIQEIKKPEKSKNPSQDALEKKIIFKEHHTDTSDINSTNLSSDFCNQPKPLTNNDTNYGEIYQKLKILKEKEIIIAKGMRFLKQKEKEIREEKNEVIKFFKNLTREL